MAETFHYIVDVNNKGKIKELYQGEDAADAMAAWSRGIADGEEYVTLEALRDRI